MALQSDPVELNIPWDELDVTLLRVEQALGYAQGNSPEPIPMLIEQALGEAPQRLRVSAGFRALPRKEVSITSDSVTLAGVRLHTGKLIASLVDSADGFAVVAATAGDALDNWARQLSTEGDPLAGFVVDALGTVVAEQAADWIEEKVAEWADEQGLSVTRQYGPGYCGWDVAEQHRLFSLLPPEFCGIRLSQSALMYPVKSVSGVIGFGEGAERKAHGCAICELSSCFRRAHARSY